MTVKYTVIDTSLIVEFFGKTDRDTLYNPTDHLCFNLNGEGDSTILDHYLKINADYFTPIDDTLITTGEIKEVKGTPFDFREYKQIGKDLNTCDKQLKNAGGYDHNFCVNGKGYREFASVYSPKTGIKMQGLLIGVACIFTAETL
jgi:aldose 1-epimerase